MYRSKNLVMINCFYWVTVIYTNIMIINAVFFQAAVVSILLYGCTTLTLIKRMEKKLDGNYTGMLRAILNKSWRQHPHKTVAVRPPTTPHENYSS